MPPRVAQLVARKTVNLEVPCSIHGSRIRVFSHPAAPFLGEVLFLEVLAVPVLLYLQAFPFLFEVS